MLFFNRFILPKLEATLKTTLWAVSRVFKNGVSPTQCSLQWQMYNQEGWIQSSSLLSTCLLNANSIMCRAARSSIRWMEQIPGTFRGSGGLQVQNEDGGVQVSPLFWCQMLEQRRISGVVSTLHTAVTMHIIKFTFTGRGVTVTVRGVQNKERLNWEIPGGVPIFSSYHKAYLAPNS